MYQAKYVTEADGTLPGRSLREQTEGFLNDVAGMAESSLAATAQSRVAAENAAQSANLAQESATRVEAKISEVSQAAGQARGEAGTAGRTADAALAAAQSAQAAADGATATAGEANLAAQQAAMCAGDAVHQAQNAASMAEKTANRADEALHTAESAATQAAGAGQAAREALATAQSGFADWNAAVDYGVRALAYGEGSVLYRALRASGPDTPAPGDGEREMTGPRQPDLSPDYWEEFIPKADHNWDDITGKPETFLPSAHQHAASDIAGGALSADRGGTGQTSLQAARNAMGLGNTTAALPIANGGTGATTAGAARTALGIPALPANVAPLPQTAAGVGQVVNFSTSGGYTLPAGGTWEIRWLKVNGTGGTNQAAYYAIMAGGSYLAAASGYYQIGWAWRIA